MREFPTAARLDVIEPVRVLSARRFGARLRLAVTHPAHRSRAIVFRFATAAAASDHHDQVTTWINERRNLAYVRGPQECALIDVDALLARLA